MLLEINLGQHFMNFESKVFNDDLKASHYLYNSSQCQSKANKSSQLQHGMSSKVVFKKLPHLPHNNSTHVQKQTGHNSDINAGFPCFS